MEAASDSALPDPNFWMTNALASVVDSTADLSDEDLQGAGANPLTLLDGNALLGLASPATGTSFDRDEIVNYVVQEGDTISNIAVNFDISINTILWANNLKENSLIKPGDELIILPRTGVLHRVKDGETISSIAKHYDAKIDEIIVFNGLPADGSIQINEKIMVPDGKMPTAKPIAKPSTRVAKNSVTGPGTGKSRSFPYGQCTWYVAQKRYVPWSGHAKSWLANARAYGFETGATAQVGAIISFSGTNWLTIRYGHVAYVEAVNDGWVTFSEMNHIGVGIKSVRTIKANSPSILGYIY